MDETLTTDGPAAEAVTTAPKRTLLEIWAQNPRMRHVPQADWILRKIDVEVRNRWTKLQQVIDGVGNDDVHAEPLSAAVKSLCRALERVADVARPGKHAPHTNDMTGAVVRALEHAVANLRHVDAQIFGRRMPFHTFERSNAEPLYGALLSALCHLDRVTALVREIDPNIDERLLEGLVTLSNPVDERMLKPIA